MSTHHPHGRWRYAFLTGDLLLVMLVGAASGAVMSLAHDVLGGFWIGAALGMAAGMAVGTGLAFAARPILGSIETSVPGMVAGMLGGMTVCAGMVVGHLTMGTAVSLGAIAGATLHVRFRWLEGRAHRRALELVTHHE